MVINNGEILAHKKRIIKYFVLKIFENAYFQDCLNNKINIPFHLEKEKKEKIIDTEIEKLYFYDKNLFEKKYQQAYKMYAMQEE